MPSQQYLFPKTVYCIDTSSLINLIPPWKKDVYRRDVFPAIWEKLESMIQNEELISPLEVYEEIKVGQDEIYEWCKKNKKMFRDIDNCQRQKLKDIEKQYDNNYWINESRKPRWADPWVISLSICEDAIIVADEKNIPNRIPSISAKFGEKCLGLLDFFKEIEIKY
ncbi:MAG: DUF4411 family protein [Candidatus Cloacimonadota bacterium]|nr:DUF4411 family protein [Candidatus Cloacimonadota bacterium]